MHVFILGLYHIDPYCIPKNVVVHGIDHPWRSLWEPQTHVLRLNFKPFAMAYGRKVVTKGIVKTWVAVAQKRSKSMGFSKPYMIRICDFLIFWALNLIHTSLHRIGLGTILKGFLDLLRTRKHQDLY